MNYIQIFLLIGFLLILGLYETISHRKKSRLPRVPLGLLLVYFLLKLISHVYLGAGLASTAASIEVASAITLWMAITRIIVYFIVDYFLRQKRGLVIPTITRDFALGIAYIIIAMIVLKQKTTVNLGSLLTTSAILTAVIGFAMQDTLGNLFSGLALQLEHPYQIGDWIGFEGTEGKVVGITWKSTKILTRSEELIYVPNNTIAKSTLINFSRPTPKHVTSFEIGTSYNDPPHKVRKAIRETILNHPKVVKDSEPSIFVVKYDNFSVNYKAFFATEDFATEGKTKFDILNDLWYKFRREGIKIPYPIQEEWQVHPQDIVNEEKVTRAKEEEKIVESLNKIEIFSGLSLEAKKELAMNMSVLHFAKDESIVTQGDVSGPMYIIKNGKCSVLISHNGGDPAQVAELSDMQFFGEMSVLTGTPRTATVKALAETTCYEIEKRDIKKLFEKYPTVPEKISEILIKRQTELEAQKTILEETLASKAEQKGLLVNRIKEFLGI